MFSVFGDSHAMCFYNTYPGNVHTYPGSSAKGLSNLNSRSGKNKEIIEKINLLPDNSNIIMFFGKVDLDFIINYKYNTIDNINYEEYILSIADSYIEFIKLHGLNKNIFVCELPFAHLSDDAMLESIQVELHMKYINQYLSDKDTDKYSKFSKIIPYDTRIFLYKLFNNKLKEGCILNNFKFLKINEYFTSEDGKIEIPAKYLMKERLNHHLSGDIVELYMKSLATKT
jgi:hypothetical protein